MSSYSTLQELVAIDSPTGFTDRANDYIEKLMQRYQWRTRRSNKGAVAASLHEKPTLALAAHTDTLGAVVSGINKNGSLQLSPVGGLVLTSFEGEYLRVYTMEGKVYTGTFLLNNPSTHANKDVVRTERSLNKMHIRLDEEVAGEDEVRELGIRIGDFVCFDTRYQELPSGYIKSRFMDNKAGCYVLFEVARRLAEQQRRLPVELFFSHYEEVGHGGTCGFAASIEELLVIDMGVIGDDCEGDERYCSICAKDSSGPYDYRMRSRLVQLAEKQDIPHKIDVYPYYGSDGSAALQAGNDFRVALIGPGVAASHGVERSHRKGIEATIDLCLAYIDDYCSRP